MLDLTSLPVVDVHSHPFLDAGQLTADQFIESVAFGGGSPAFMAEGGIAVDATVEAELQRNKRDTVYVRHLVRRMAAFFGCQSSVDAVAEARNATLRQGGYHDYVRRLYAACGLQTLIADFGFPQPSLAVEAFRAESPAAVVPLYRIEPLIATLLKAELGWDEFRARYDETLARALRDEGYRGLKSIIAYRTGLAVSPLSRSADQGRHALDAIRRGSGGQATKLLRDHLLCRAMELCMEHDVPMQIHCGMGDAEVNLVACRPALLKELLAAPPFRACHVLLVHGGYPYHAEAGYLANVLPRVYVDVSEGIPFAGGAARRIFAEILEMAPLSKVVYGSDVFRMPETAYISALQGKEALAHALQDLVDGGLLGSEEAYEAAALILAGTAQRLYRLAV